MDFKAHNNTCLVVIYGLWSLNRVTLAPSCPHPAWGSFWGHAWKYTRSGRFDIVFMDAESSQRWSVDMIEYGEKTNGDIYTAQLEYEETNNNTPLNWNRIRFFGWVHILPTPGYVNKRRKQHTYCTSWIFGGFCLGVPMSKRAFDEQVQFNELLTPRK